MRAYINEYQNKLFIFYLINQEKIWTYMAFKTSRILSYQLMFRYFKGSDLPSISMSITLFTSVRSKEPLRESFLIDLL